MSADPASAFPVETAGAEGDHFGEVNEMVLQRPSMTFTRIGFAIACAVLIAWAILYYSGAGMGWWG